jgi:hypothetical protein
MYPYGSGNIDKTNIFDMDFLRPFQGVKSHSLVSEFFAVANGIKPVLRTYAIRPKMYPLLRSICLENGLHTEHSNFMVSDDTNVSDSGRFFFVYISKDKNLVKEAKEVEERITMGIKNDYEEHLRFSQLMGYPRCCFDFFFENVKKNPTTHLIEFEAHKNTKKFSYLLNNLLRGNEYLISHYPCRYDCPKSMKYAKYVLRLIKETDPELADRFIKILKLPIMKFERTAGYVRFFDGRVEENKIKYSGCWGFETLYRLFEKGNVLLAERKRIKIFRNGVYIDEYKKETERDGIIFDFR